VLVAFRSAILDDDQLLQSTSAIFDELLTAFEKEIPTS